ncbi:MAG: hypothetical protein QNJ98_09840 [Planctomycetota bacterium]|nr:hypothetical protein [Planctomycetota bacterium]
MWNRVALVVLAGIACFPAPVMAEGGPSARKLAARLTDGNEHRARNNQLVAKLVEQGQKSIVPLLQCVNDPEFEGRGYAAWALAEVVRKTKADPAMVVPALRVAAQSDDEYVGALARSALGRLDASHAAQRPARKPRFGPSPYIQAALQEAPGPDATIEELVRRLGEREGHWQEIVLDRIIARGDAAKELLGKALDDKAFPARAYAAWGLGRVHRALGQKPEAVIDKLRGLLDDDDKNVRHYASAGLRALGQETPLGDVDGRKLKSETIVAALAAGQQSVMANNVLIDQMLLHGEKSLPALLATSKDPKAPNRFYADWAMAKVLRMTGLRPKELVTYLKSRYAPGRSPISILGF